MQLCSALVKIKGLIKISFFSSLFLKRARVTPNPFPMISKHVLVITVILFFSSFAHAIVDYANVFIDPDYVLSENFPVSLGAARLTIMEWAAQLNSQGPWCECIPLFSMREWTWLQIILLTSGSEQIRYPTFWW